MLRVYFLLGAIVYSLLGKDKEVSFGIQDLKLKQQLLEKNSKYFQESFKWQEIKRQWLDYHLLFQKESLSKLSNYKQLAYELQQIKKFLDLIKNELAKILSLDKNEKLLKEKIVSLKRLFALRKTIRDIVVLDKNKELGTVILSSGSLNGIVEGQIFIGSDFSLSIVKTGNFVSVAQILDNEKMVNIGKKVKLWK